MVTGVVGLTLAFVSPFMPLFLGSSLHATPPRVALFLFSMPLAAVGVGTVIGRISDRPGQRHRLLLVAGVASGTAYGIFSVVHSYWVLLAVALTLMAVGGSMLALIFAYVREVLDREFSANAAMGISALRMLVSVSWVAGPALGAYLIASIGFSGLWAVTAAAYPFILVLLLMVRRSAATSRYAVGGSASRGATASTATASTATASTATASTATASTATASTATAPAAAASVATPPATTSADARPSTVEGKPGRGTLIATSVAFILMQSAGGLGVMTAPLFVSVVLHHSIREAGLVLGLCAALEIPLMLLFGAMTRRFTLGRLVLVGGSVGSTYFALASLTGAVWQLAALQVINACFISAVGGLGISYFQELLPSALGRATTMFTNSNRLSGMLAGGIFGLVEIAGYRFAYVAATVLCVSGVAVLAGTRRRSVTSTTSGRRIDGPRVTSTRAAQT
jgi:SET family sugar efflux transporter-like MFS transporter